jgi:hypothetical protein
MYRYRPFLTIRQKLAIGQKANNGNDGEDRRGSAWPYLTSA